MLSPIAVDESLQQLDGCAAQGSGGAGGVNRADLSQAAFNCCYIRCARLPSFPAHFPGHCHAVQQIRAVAAEGRPRHVLEGSCQVA